METACAPIPLRYRLPGPRLHRRDIGCTDRAGRVHIKPEIQRGRCLTRPRLHAADVTRIDRTGVVDVADEEADGCRGRVHRTVDVRKRDRDALIVR